MKKKVLISSLVLICIIAVSVFAHSGNTDSNGGHYNRTTGKYHYHHGERAHQHKDGKCPYDKDYNIFVIGGIIVSLIGVPFIIDKFKK